MILSVQRPQILGMTFTSNGILRMHTFHTHELWKLQLLWKMFESILGITTTQFIRWCEHLTTIFRLNENQMFNQFVVIIYRCHVKWTVHITYIFIGWVLFRRHQHNKPSHNHCLPHFIAKFSPPLHTCIVNLYKRGGISRKPLKFKCEYALRPPPFIPTRKKSDLLEEKCLSCLPGH